MSGQMKNLGQGFCGTFGNYLKNFIEFLNEQAGKGSTERLKQTMQQVKNLKRYTE